MSMHMHHASLTTTGKKKGKVKWASAAQKAAAMQLDAEWADLRKRHSATPVAQPKKRILTKVSKVPALTYRGSTDDKIPSVNTGWHACTKGADKVYSGDKIVGISTLHKSNAVPVFSQEAAIEIARMRR